MKLSDLIKDKSKIDLQDICSDWQWLISGQKNILLVTVFGDMFLVGPFNEINWLDTGACKLIQVADTVKKFEEFLRDEAKFSDWFRTNVYLELQQNNILLRENEVYGYKKIPLLGGDYSLENIETTDISVHFSITGQICKKTKDLTDGTKVRVSMSRQRAWWKIW